LFSPEWSEEVMADQRDQPDVVPHANASAETLLEVIQTLALELHPHRQHVVSANLDSSLDRELGFDSLGRVELLQRVEHAFGVQLPDDLLTTAETPRDILRAVTTAGAHSRTIDAKPPTPLLLPEVPTVPIGASTLIEVLDWHVQAHPERLHLYFYGDLDVAEEISYAQLRTGAGTVAAGLQERGLQYGQMVAIMLPTSLDFFYSFYGGWRACWGHRLKGCTTSSPCRSYPTAGMGMSRPLCKRRISPSCNTPRGAPAPPRA
jgi:acyl carrier protein